MAFIKLTFLLFCGHALADFALQSEFVAKNKNRHAQRDRILGDSDSTEIIWPWLLGAHSLHHGLVVYLITQNAMISICETIVHAAIDFGKCERWFSFHTDQVLHLVTKILWALILNYYLSH